MTVINGSKVCVRRTQLATGRGRPIRVDGGTKRTATKRPFAACGTLRPLIDGLAVAGKECTMCDRYCYHAPLRGLGHLKGGAAAEDLPCNQQSRRLRESTVFDLVTRDRAM